MIRSYSITELLAAVRRLPPRMQLSEQLHKSGYETHQDHWLGWAGDYNDPGGGYYGRSDTTITDAKKLYNRLNCGPMMIWLLEAAGESPVMLRMTVNEMRARGGGRAQTEAKIVRDRHPWERVAQLLFRQ